MHIAIVNITSGGLSGGYLKYLRSILPGIAKDPRVERVDLFVPPGVELEEALSDRAQSWAHNDGATHFRKLRAELRRMRPDVVFVPTARWLDCGDTPVVSMVRNMEPLLIPFSPRNPIEIIKNLARRYAAYNSCVHSAGVIAVSAFVRDFLHEQWHVPSERLAIVYHGVTSPSRQLGPTRPEGVQTLLNRPFVFTAGSIRPARGLEDVIKAVAAMLREGRPIGLAIAGAVDARMCGYRLYLQQLATDLGCAEHIIWLGSLDTASMSWAFSNCSAFVMTSRAEACPNIGLEAMAHRCVCVSTDTPPMPEIFRDAAVYYNANDWRSLSNALNSALNNDTSAVSAMRDRARARATEFSWDHAVRATVDFLETRSKDAYSAVGRA